MQVKCGENMTAGDPRLDSATFAKRGFVLTSQAETFHNEQNRMPVQTREAQDFPSAEAKQKSSRENNEALGEADTPLGCRSEGRKFLHRLPDVFPKALGRRQRNGKEVAGFCTNER